MIEVKKISKDSIRLSDNKADLVFHVSPQEVKDIAMDLMHVKTDAESLEDLNS